MYLEMAPVMLLYNVFRNRWCGAYWASKGLRVIPTVNWGDESSFDFCFEGIEKGSVVAVSTYMATEHDNRKDQKEWFIAGYNEMLRQIEPERIICYNTPFPEMRGDIVYVDYERSSWKYMNYERGFAKEDLDAFKIGGAYPAQCDTIEPYLISGTKKGGGSAYGGEYKPAKQEDERFLGKPGEIKVFYKRDGTKFETKIGPDGKAVAERHHTVHSPNHLHSNPHDHKINWETPRYGKPNLEDAVNYWDGNAPDFKNYTVRGTMKSVVFENSSEENRFKTISDFKECMIRGGEVVFIWNNTRYGIVRSNGKFHVASEGKLDEKWYDNPDDILEYMVGSDRLREVITQVTVLDRTI